MPQESTVDNGSAQGAISIIASKAESLVTNPSAWVTVGALLYQWVTAPVKLSNHPTNPQEQDLQRYERMCAEYLRILQKPKIPVEWELKDGCPTHRIKLSESAESFRIKAETIRDSSHTMKAIIVGMISTVERLYESLMKRTATFYACNEYRPDGYEAMFFADLVQWLSSELPAASITSPRTLKMLDDRIAFCTEVYRTVFIYREDGKKNNPREKLNRINDSLNTLREDIKKSIDAASFNAIIEQIDNNFLEMAMNAFNICHLILDGVNQRELQVAEFLKPGEVDTKVIALNQSTMGQWINITLRTLGVTSNNFQSNGKAIDFDTIMNHLPTPDFKKLTLNTTGLIETIRSDSTKEKKENEQIARNILLKVLDIHRGILKLYYVKSALTNSARVSVNLGESWLYGDDDGKIVVRALFAVIQDANHEFNKIIEDFWKLFYTDTYEPIEKRLHICSTNATYNFIDNARTRMSRIVKSSKEIDNAIGVLTKKAEDFKNDAETTKKEKRVLISSLYEYMRRKANVEPHLVEELSRLVDRETAINDKPGVTNITLAPLLVEPHIIRIPAAKLPIYQRAKRLLVDKAVLEENELLVTLMEDPRKSGKKFHTDYQERLYDEFLVPVNKIVDSGWFYSTWYSLTTFSMDVLRDFYLRVNRIMTDLYALETLERVNLNNSSAAIATTAIAGVISAEREVKNDNFVDEDDVFYNVHKGSVTPWTTELMIVDQQLKIARYNVIKKYQPDPISSSTSDCEIIQITPKGENIEVSIDTRLLTFAGGAYAIELKKRDRRIAELEAENDNTRDALTAQINKLLAELKSKNEVLVGQDEAIAKLNARCLEYEARVSRSVTNVSTNPNVLFAQGNSTNQANSSGHVCTP